MAGMKVLVTGGRNYDNKFLVNEVLDAFHEHFTIRKIIQGGATGADKLALDWAVRNQVTYITYKAQWAKYGKPAGPKRNAKMLHKEHPDIVIAFPGDTGTANMTKLARSERYTVLRTG